MPNKKLPVNIQIFVDHLTVGLDAAGLDFADFHPMTGTSKETGEFGFLFTQIPYEEEDSIETTVIVHNDRVEFLDHSVSLVMNNQSPPSEIAILFLVAMIKGEVITPPDCPCCLEEAAK
jgi:hypothetical protein